MLLTKQQTQNILDNAPKGSDKTKVLDQLILKGYDIEGIDSGSRRQQLQPQTEEKKQTFGQKIKESAKSSIEYAKSGYKEARDAENVGELVGGSLKIAGGAIGTAFSPLAPITEPIGDVIEKTGDKISDIPAVQKFAVSPAGEATSKIAEGVQNLSSIAGVVAGGVAPKSGLKLKVPLKSKVGNTGGIYEKLGQTETKIRSGFKTAPEDIMNKVAKVTPKESQTFKSMTGKNIGQYLSEKGNFNAPSKIVENEAITFTKTLADKEATLAKLPGEFKSGIINDVLKELKDKAVSTSTKNVKAPYLKQVNEWITKAKSTGLNNAEINSVKKLFEREVKFGYNKLTDATKVKQATYLDEALRKFQDDTASNLGFTNIKELSKQIQASKFIVDKLGNKIVSDELRGGVNLTDYIILSGGEPASVGAFLTKKLFSSKGIQAKVASALSNSKVKAPIKANYSPQATKATQTSSKIKKGISPKSTTKSVKSKGIKY